MDPSLPTGAQFRQRFLAATFALAGMATLLIALYLAALVRLPAMQWRFFAWIVSGLFVVLFLAQDRVNRRLWEPIAAVLDGMRRGQVGAQQVAAGFESASNTPGLVLRIGLGWWMLGGLVVAAAMKLRFSSFSLFSGAVMFAAAASGGFIMAVVDFFVLKRLLEPVRLACAERLPDPARRRALVRREPLARKITVAVAGVTVLTVIFAVLCAQVRSGRPLEAHATALQARYLERLAPRIAAEGDAALEAGAREARELGIAEAMGVLDASRTHTVAGDLDLVEREEWSLIADTGLAVGDSTRFDSPHVMAWRRLEDGRLLVAVSRWEPMRMGLAGDRVVFGLLIVIAFVLAAVLARLLADDVGRATERLREEAERLSSGDLRRGRVFESEDELGDLSRAFEAMGESLRGTVSRVVSAADRVEGTAAEMAEVVASVAGVTAAQVEGIKRTTSSMEAINTQVRGIADSSQALNVSVEESSSSILELGAAGEELNETASVLSERVSEVSTSIEQLVRSVKQVLEGTEALAEAAVETSASMGEMATSMREVDASAEQTARLSEEVVSYAEVGQAKMVQTIEGMDAIREATETAERVIRSLGGRASEIGAIVDVIDDVADETNLLALNAAIIAAQAGEHGRAFSVVADEIRDLADRVLASTKEIGGLIRAVQAESENAIGAIEKGAASVAGGVDLTAEAGASLEEITRASRASGQRISGIVAAVREQARAASQVVDLMERVREGVEEIRSAAVEQDRSNEVISRSSVAMRDVALQVRGTTEEQARGSGRIRESIEGVREAVERINSSLQEQSAACRSAVEFLEAIYTRTRSNEQSAVRLDQVAKSLVHQAQALRDDVQRFRVA
jgi:methyl-accepting chemotaxis protein